MSFPCFHLSTLIDVHLSSVQDLPIQNLDNTIGITFDQSCILRGKHDRGSLLVEIGEDPHNLKGHLGIQIPCGLIGENQGRGIDQSSSDGHSLLFPCGEGENRVFLPSLQGPPASTFPRLYFLPPSGYDR